MQKIRLRAGYGAQAEWQCSLLCEQHHFCYRFDLWTMDPPPVSLCAPQAKTETITTINEDKGMSNENWSRFSFAS